MRCCCRTWVGGWVGGWVGTDLHDGAGGGGVGALNVEGAGTTGRVGGWVGG